MFTATTYKLGIPHCASHYSELYRRNLYNVCDISIIIMNYD